MYHVFKVPGTSLPFIQNLILAGSIRSKLVSAAAGHVVGMLVPLGPKEHLAPHIYFREVAQSALDEYLNGLSSVGPVSVDAIRSYAEKWYLLRHRVAHGGCMPSATGINGAYNILHIGEFFTPEEIGMFKFEGQRFAGHVSGFEPIFRSAVETSLKNVQAPV